MWEYISLYWREPPLNLNLVYRAYRYPYDWVPQLDRPTETPISRFDNQTFRVPGAAPLGRDRSITVRGAAVGAELEGASCVTPDAPLPLSAGG